MVSTIDMALLTELSPSQHPPFHRKQRRTDNRNSILWWKQAYSTILRSGARPSSPPRSGHSRVTVARASTFAALKQDGMLAERFRSPEVVGRSGAGRAESARQFGCEGHSSLACEPGRGRVKLAEESSVRSGRLVVQCLAVTVLVAFLSMPLLTELISRADGLDYRHGAPDGACFEGGWSRL